MPWVKGQSGNPATQFQKGVSGNPGGKKKGVLNRKTQALNKLMDVAEDVIAGKDGLDQWRENLKQTWAKDPWPVWKWLVQVMPKESLTITRDEGGAFAKYTVDQLRQIAGVADDEPEPAEKVIEVEVSDAKAR